MFEGEEGGKRGNVLMESRTVRWSCCRYFFKITGFDIRIAGCGCTGE